ncbi:MAG: tRNA pseudouridine(13) synthase TruD, partial [Candidatus Brocadiales bacterium]|nr:tRNA pseudouridine(13) synthase TruD [Candidatus Brocadiales bacterium]
MIKVKVNPEDFVVEEVADLPFEKAGNFCVYLLKKRGWNTVDVLKNLSKKLNLPSSYFSYGGKKDKYALTSQYITIARRGGNQTAAPNAPFSNGRHGGLGGSNKGALKEVSEKNYSLSFVGRMDRPM